MTQSKNSQSAKPIGNGSKTKALYTGQKVLKSRPLVYAECVDMLGRGVSPRAITRTLGLHHYTVATIADEERETVDAIRSKLAKEFRAAARLQVNRLIEQPDKVPINVAALTASQCLDKSELLEGRATVRTEEHKRIDIFSDYPQPGQFVEWVQKHLHPSRPKELAPSQAKEVRSDSQTGSEMGLTPRKKLPIT